ncbi:hypothetical protein GCM10022254_31060 [Actinomadura meridiana]|uniref:N-acetyltransferase domain-containing protein n=1 Tax=Actinomadura meridiana TaxID=559626 RepID=A0ABP8C1R7_9ACTN
MRSREYVRLNGGQALEILEPLTDVYREIYDGESYGDDALFSRAQFKARTSAQCRGQKFELVKLLIDGRWAGFSFGLQFPAGAWWANASEPPRSILALSKFAVIELGIRPAYRGQGLSKRLLANILGGRDEAFATLTSIPGTPAHDMYERWGWSKVTTVGGEGPKMDALILPLPFAE